MPRRDPSKTIWRVLHRVPGKTLAQTIYWGRGEKAQQTAEQKYKTVRRRSGRIGLYRGIFAVHTRVADKADG